MRDYGGQGRKKLEQVSLMQAAPGAGQRATFGYEDGMAMKKRAATKKNQLYKERSAHTSLYNAL